MQRPLVFAVLLLIVGGVASPTIAQRTTTYEQITVSSTAVALASATYSGMAGCEFQVETAAIRWRVDGTSPTTTVGMPLAVDVAKTLTNAVDLRLFRAIRSTGVDGVLNVRCWPRE